MSDPLPPLPSIYLWVCYYFSEKKGMLVMTSSHTTVQWSVTCNWQCKERGKAWVDWKVIGLTKEVSAFSQSKFPNLLKIPSHTHTHTHTHTDCSTNKDTTSKFYLPKALTCMACSLLGWLFSLRVWLIRVLNQTFCTSTLKMKSWKVLRQIYSIILNQIDQEMIQLEEPATPKGCAGLSILNATDSSLFKI